ncbi:hypothetical protein JMA_43950 (plasmid) [Jeotgalibacillus malaysiensis]|uniref:Uncharacterized protein n=1 Tax=Jeotgalibacillus malaysiensis TaxID=1508404 RepID=A0A0B5AYG9_9BACL|nr:hypothetical protein [Jeotgalibacillus malaysiensis]AJD93712.1 hypothetical protein JMA_43950 [Jeotgalibacillus malaysiensis]
MKKEYEAIISLYRGDHSKRLQEMIDEFEKEVGKGKISEQLESEKTFFMEQEKACKH